MEQKDTYTLMELFNNLPITMTELKNRSGISDVTLASIRDGNSARRSSINKLLHTFSELYKVPLSLDNVRGIVIKDKLAKIEEATKIQSLPSVEPKKPDVLIPASDYTPTVASPLLPSTDVKKRAYTPRKSNLPDGCIPAIEFANTHGVSREAMRWHMNNGLGPGLIHGPDVPEDGTVQVRDWIRYEERNKRVRKDGTVEMERYLTSDQQHDALNFWKRHDVSFAECNDIGCWCHTVKNGE
jgi:hypothetical protein